MDGNNGSCQALSTASHLLSALSKESVPFDNRWTPMQPSFICARCQWRILRKSIKSKQPSQRNFVSLNQNTWGSHAQQSQDDIIPPKQKELEAKRLASRPTYRATDGNVNDSINSVLVELFDANRHKLPSGKSRYSKKLKKPEQSLPEPNVGYVTSPYPLAYVLAEQKKHGRTSEDGFPPSAAGPEPPQCENRSAALFPSMLSEVRVPHSIIKSRSTSQRIPNDQAVRRIEDVPATQGGPPEHVKVSSSSFKASALPCHSNLTGLNLEEEAFEKEMARIEHRVSNHFDNLSRVLLACQNLVLPSRNTRLRTKFYSMIKLISEKILTYYSRPGKLSRATDDLPILVNWYQKYQLILQDWYPKLISVYLRHFRVSIHHFQRHRHDHILVQHSIILESIVYLWRCYFSMISSASKSFVPEPINDQDFPTIETIITQRENVSPKSMERIEHFFPNIPRTDLPQMSSLVLITCAIIQNAASTSAVPLQSICLAEPLVSAFWHMMRGAEFDVENMQQFWDWDRDKQRLLQQWQQFEVSLKEDLPYLQSELKRQSISVSGESIGKRKSKTTPVAESQTSLVSEMKDKLFKAVNFQEFHRLVLAGDTRKTNELWQRFCGQADSGQYKLKALETIFADFLWGFVNLRKLEPINEVWTVMIERGVRPTTHHWNAVLEVLQKNREFSKFQTIWQEMINAGCAPDNHSWTTYIMASLEERRWKHVVSICQEMGEAWQTTLQSAQTDIPGSRSKSQYLPSMVPINAAITGLLRMDRSSLAEDLLRWAQGFPVDVDASTYNIFLLHRCKDGNTAGSKSVIAEMEKNNVSPDVVTRTIILDSELRNPLFPLHHLNPEEQEERVISELQKMFDDGLTPNAQTFAVVLHSLLNVTKPNLPAANAVFRLLLKLDQHVPPHIYTILFTHYFKAEPPDLKALESLWEKVEKEKSRIDHVLYDRMIEGYASIGEVERMISFFRKMTEAGQVPGWLALEKALSTLVKQRRWDLCADFVADATNDGGHLHLGKRGWRGEKEFRQLVRELENQNLIPKLAELQ